MTAGEPLGGWWDDFRTAAAFLTRLPVGLLGSTSGSGNLTRASRTFPLVGIVIGGISAVVYGAAVDLGLTAPLASALAVAAGIVATGALHEDGLADTADGLGARGSAAAKLAAMRDSHIGVFGTLALILGLLLRVVALSALVQPSEVACALIAAHAGGRALLPWVMYQFAPARADGLAVAAGRPSRTTAAIALALGAAVLLLVEGPRAVAAGAAACLSLLLVPLARRQFGGMTGDVLGAIEQIAAIAILLALVATR